jgi:hypothetical protein
MAEEMIKILETIVVMVKLRRNKDKRPSGWGGDDIISES